MATQSVGGRVFHSPPFAVSLVSDLMLSGLLITSVCLAIAGAQEANLQSCVPDGAFDPAVDYFPVKSQHINSDFSISYANSFKTIVNNLTNQTIILYQCGTPRPDIPVGAKAFAIRMFAFAYLLKL